MTRRVLVVDDSDGARANVERAFAELGPDFARVVGQAGDGIEALEWLAREVADIVALDLDMPRMDGITFLRHARERHPDLRVVVVSDHHHEDLSTQALRLGACAVLPKSSIQTQQLADALGVLLGRA